MVECIENDHKVDSKCFICNSFIVLLRDDLNTFYMGKILLIYRYLYRNKYYTYAHTYMYLGTCRYACHAAQRDVASLQPVA